MSHDSVPYSNRSPRSMGAALGGLILIVLGATFLLQSLGLLGRQFHWWALFILIPALSSFWAAGMAVVRGGGRFTAAARGSLGGGLIILTVALMFLLGLDWSRWWPLMLIVPGAAIIINGFSDTTNPDLKALARMNWWVGAAVAGLGAMFLLNALHVFSLRVLFGTFQWWGFFILVPGLGAFVSAFGAFRANGHRLTGSVRGLLVAGAALTAVAAVALLGLSWNWLMPIILIASGVVLLAGMGPR
jgi:hypothetical protein